MGSTFFHATHYKNGKVDRKAEFIELLNDLGIKGNYSIRGNVAYCACTGVDKDTFTEYTYCTVVVTYLNSKDYFNFGYKIFDESECPIYYDVPKSIFSKLTELPQKHKGYSDEWRSKCKERLSIA